MFKYIRSISISKEHVNNDPTSGLVCLPTITLKDFSEESLPASKAVVSLKDEEGLGDKCPCLDLSAVSKQVKDQ